MIQFQMLYVAFSVNEYRSGKKKNLIFHRFSTEKE